MIELDQEVDEAELDKIDISNKEQVKSLLNLLTPKQKEAMMLRYGIETYKPLSFEAVGSLMGITKAAARQHVVLSLKKIKKIGV